MDSAPGLGQSSLLLPDPRAESQGNPATNILKNRALTDKINLLSLNIQLQGKKIENIENTPLEIQDIQDIYNTTDKVDEVTQELVDYLNKLESQLSQLSQLSKEISEYLEDRERSGQKKLPELFKQTVKEINPLQDGQDERINQLYTQSEERKNQYEEGNETPLDKLTKDSIVDIKTAEVTTKKNLFFSKEDVFSNPAKHSPKILLKKDKDGNIDFHFLNEDQQHHPTWLITLTTKTQYQQLDWVTRNPTASEGAKHEASHDVLGPPSFLTHDHLLLNVSNEENRKAVRGFLLYLHFHYLLGDAFFERIKTVLGEATHPDLTYRPLMRRCIENWVDKNKLVPKKSDVV